MYKRGMCRLFGFRSRVHSRAHRSLVEAENSIVKQAALHPDGWGIGYFVGRDAYILKSDAGAHDSERFRLASSRLQSQSMVVHVRRATHGQTDHLNSHPFRFGRWVFAHNGTLWKFPQYKDWIIEQVKPNFRPLILGQTDSEHLFHYLLCRLDAAGVDRAGHEDIDEGKVVEVIQGAMTSLYEHVASLGIRPPIINYILTNGDHFFSQRAGKSLYFATQKKSCADFDICTEANKVCMDLSRKGSSVTHLLIASERIGDEDRWEEVEEGGMVCLSPNFEINFYPPFDKFTAIYDDEDPDEVVRCAT